MGKPIIVAVDDEPESLKMIEGELSARYGRDYEILVERSAAAALELLESLRDGNGEVALILSDQWMPGMTGSELLMRAHKTHPEAKRGLLVDVSDISCAGTMLQAITFGQTDYYATKPFGPPDESFHRFVTQFLEEWNELHRPRFQLVRIVGKRWAPRSHELREFLDRGGIVSGFYDVDSEEGRKLLRAVRCPADRLPVCILYDARVLVDPTNTELAEAAGVNTHPEDELYDLTVVGAGPAGLSATVYGASEGLSTVVLERDTIGGQAGTSSLIRNYLGFPRGISGGELMRQAYRQAWLFRAQFVFTRQVVGLRAEGPRRVITLSNGEEITGRSVLLATGIDYRKLEIERLNRLIGAGVFYGTAASEVQAMRDRNVFVAGAGNSAGQAAVNLAKYAQRVTILVRGGSLTDTMSDYLLKEIKAKGNVTVRLNTEVVDGFGTNLLQRLVLRDNLTGEREEVEASALFILIGGAPRTDWLPPALERDGDGFIYTGSDLEQVDHRWPVNRAPLPMETSMPGVFAAGDVRHGSMKRVASAVGEGASVIRHIHEFLRRA